MNKCLFVFLFALIVAIGHPAHAQYYMDGEGRPIKQENDEVEGSPFLYAEWNIGSAVDEKGKEYKNLKLKYDVFGDRPVFAGNNDETMAFTDRIASFTIDGKTFVSGLPAVDKYTAASYYELIGDGKVKLLKHYVKTVEAKKDFQSAVKKYRINDGFAYYLLKDGKLTAIRLNKNSILSIMNDQAEKMNAYVALYRINFKDIADVAKLCTYYNSL